ALFTVTLGRFDTSTPLKIELIRPLLETPSWSTAAMIELVVPLPITVLAIQNSQGIAVLTSAGFEPPINAITIACGIGSAGSARVGGRPATLPRPRHFRTCARA